MAEQLIKIAALRQLSTVPPIDVQPGLYEEFAARFPYEETEDQLTAISAVFEDLASGKVMDRLVCGDVGFGKTEVALRAAFAVAMSGRQVAVVVPTTLLVAAALQDLPRALLRPAAARCAGLAARLGAELKATKEGVADGKVDIVVGTHALLSKSIDFKDLGLLIVDEEQHFGVGHKERLKELKGNVHVLTLTATPIPRTLQLALTGVRDLSLLATPPVDRLAIRTFISPFDPLSRPRGAAAREVSRRAGVLRRAARSRTSPTSPSSCAQQVPEVSFVVANGQMPPGELDDIMNNFYDGKFDVLVATTIVESGLDIPNANTLIVHRADNFGLAQLYQIRGRIGRAKQRAYALFTVPADRKLNDTAERRLSVLQSLESARRRLPAGEPRSRHPRRRQPARRRAVGPYPRGRLRALPGDAGGGGGRAAQRRCRLRGPATSGARTISLGMPVMIPSTTCPTCRCACSSTAARRPHRMPARSTRPVPN